MECLRSDLLAGVFVAVLCLGCSGEHRDGGVVTDREIPFAVIQDRQATEGRVAAALRRTAGGPAAPRIKQILFGDLHAHTTFSPDAFSIAMPIMGGEGVHPPADACDFARYCSALDFWSINDHAEGISPLRWEETKESIRQCNAVAGDPENPDLVAFLGWEWSNVGRTPETHFGHKNVIFLDTDEDRVPRRPIAAVREQIGKSPVGPGARLALSLLDFENRQVYYDMGTYFEEMGETPLCEEGVDTRDLPTDCHERARDPEQLFAKLDSWGFETIVIPHGNSWGLNTTPGTTWEKQLTRAQHSPEMQSLIELYSGHGNAEEYRDWRAAEVGEEGNETCPIPSEDFLPCCWQAGEIIRSRCDDPSSTECEANIIEARQNYVDAGVTGYWTVPNTAVEEWLDCGQCEDCFNAPFDHRPATSTQAALALTNFDDPADPLRFRFGFIGSSDNHRGRPGSGYKEVDRFGMTDVIGARMRRLADAMNKDRREPVAKSEAYDHEKAKLGLNKLRHMERQASFFMTGGLVAVHAEGRSREEIWDALRRREVYATSGDRILLWFELSGDDNVVVPMGAETKLGATPHFRVRAAGSLEQNPGCPKYVEEALSPDRLKSLCRGECYNPSDTRRQITRIEIVRIRPQENPTEDLGELIEDPWRVFACEPSPAGCVVEFDDPEFLSGRREVIYYARAIQEPTPAINAGGLRCERDESGQCTSVDVCYGDYRTPIDDDCLSENEERAWSSPIFVAFQK